MKSKKTKPPVQDPNVEKAQRAQKCASEIDAILKKHNCGIKSVVVIQEIGPIIYDKQVYTLD